MASGSEQVSTVDGKFSHAKSQLPQCSAVVMSVSQPLAKSPSQSSRPLGQPPTISQDERSHEKLTPEPALDSSAQRKPQAPQWLTLLLVSTSQPSENWPLQSLREPVQEAT